MGDPRHNPNRPFVRPPAGSDLAYLCARLEAEMGEPINLAGYMGDNMRSLVVEAAVNKGVPKAWADQPPAWLDDFIQERTLHLQLRLLEDPDCVKPVRGAGRPGGPDSFPAIILMREYLRQQAAAPSGTSHYALCRAVATALGPGITRDHVARAFGWMLRNPHKARAALLGVVHLESLISKYRSERPPVRRQGAR